MDDTPQPFQPFNPATEPQEELLHPARTKRKYTRKQPTRSRGRPRKALTSPPVSGVPDKQAVDRQELAAVVHIVKILQPFDQVRRKFILGTVTEFL